MKFKRRSYTTQKSEGTCSECGAPVYVKKTSDGKPYWSHLAKDRPGKPHEPRIAGRVSPSELQR